VLPAICKEYHHSVFKDDMLNTHGVRLILQHSSSLLPCLMCVAIKAIFIRRHKHIRTLKAKASKVSTIARTFLGNALSSLEILLAHKTFFSVLIILVATVIGCFDDNRS